MEIFDAGTAEEENDEQNNNDTNKDDQPSTEDQDEKGEKQQEEDQNGIDGNYDFNEYKMDEKLIDTDSENQSSESVIQKINKGIGDVQYKIFTEYVVRGDSNALFYYIKCYMVGDKKNPVNISNEEDV